MKISVITPTFNSGKTIGQNIRSVLLQEYKEFEHIIVDNNSSDNTIEKIKNIYGENNQLDKLKIICEKDNGIADAFNKGINAVDGEIIAILNSDDEYYDGRVFSRIIKEFDNRKILIVHGDVYFVDETYGTNRRAPKPCPVTDGIQFNHPTMFIRKSLYNEIGLYNEGFRLSMDFELYCRISRKYKNVEKISAYITDAPVVIMNAGGASWNREIESIHEIKKALKLYNYWDLNGAWFVFLRLARTRIKKVLSKFGMYFIIKLWRRLKWE